MSFTNIPGQPIYNTVSDLPVNEQNGKLATLVNGDIYTFAAGVWSLKSSSSAGTVTSVGLSLPSIFTVSNSPVTTSGTLTGTFNTETANTVFSGPTSGGAATPTFRSLVSEDIPSLSGTYLVKTNNLSDVTSTSTSFKNLSPLTSAGDIIIENNTPTPSRLAIGTSLQVLKVVSGLPAWSDANTFNISSISSNTSAVAQKTYLCDTSGATFNLTLPTPVLNAFVSVKDSMGSFQTNNLSVLQNSSEKIEGLAATKLLQTNWGNWTFVSNGTDWFMV